MLGVLVTLAVVVGCAGVGLGLGRRWLDGLDAALRIGVAGLLGIGTLGTLTFFLGVIPGGFQWGIGVVGLFALAGWGWLLTRERESLRLQVPKGPAAIGLLLLAVLGIFTLISVLAPSDMDDWDTLAYHLAVPKLWIAAGHLYSVPSLSHSNFPDVIDGLYVWGLQWGGESGAKAFTLGFLILGMVSVFGFARGRYGGNAGWWAAAAFATGPAVLWEAGTAYIDLGNGLFAGLGIAFAALVIAEENRDRLALAGILLGFAAGSKYTGLETIFLVAFTLLAYGVAKREAGSGFRSALLLGVVAMAVAAPWYVKNTVLVKNPVYPFMYEKMGGANWDQRRADAYRHEQDTFGVGRVEGKLQPSALGHAVLGLAYQPGRYVNPGQERGLGTPLGAVGVGIFAGLILWPLSGKGRRFEGAILASCGLTLLAWFFLSQQSRYIAAIAPAAAILTGGAVVRLGLGKIAAGVVALQSLFTVYLFQTMKFTEQSQVALGKVSAEDYRTTHIPFYAAAHYMNQNLGKGKVALYDEVFGYLLDVPYMWANPGHSTLIPYDRMQNADDYVREMKALGFTHAYISLSKVVKAPDFVAKWIPAMGLNGPVTPFDPSFRQLLWNDWQAKWNVLLADAVAEGKLRPVQSFRSGILFEFQ